MTCRACSGRGSQSHIGAHVSEPCDKCAPTDAEYKAWLESLPASEYGHCGDCETALTAKESDSGIFCAKCASKIEGYFDTQLGAA